MNLPSSHLFALLFLPFTLSAKIDFAHQVMPILKKNCAECHTDGKKKGGLSMNTRAEFLAGGENGEMVLFSSTDYANHLNENTPALDFA